MKTGNNKKVFSFFSILIIVIAFLSCSENEEPEVPKYSTFDEKSKLFRDIAEEFNSIYQSNSFELAVESTLNELNNNPGISNAGMSGDTLSIWWETMDNFLFVLQVKIYNEFVDSLNNDDITKKEIVLNEKYHSDIIKPHNNKALLLSPSYYDWAPYARPSTDENKDINFYFKQKLEDRGFEVDYYRNETPQQNNFSLELYENWNDYGVISFSGHGDVVGSQQLYGISSGIRATTEFENLHWDKFTDNRFMYIGKVSNSNYKYVGITNIYFLNQYPGYLTNVFVLISACKSQENSILARDLIRNPGKSVYWGWTDDMMPLAGAWRNTKFMIDQLLDHGKTSGETYNLMVENNRHRHWLYGRFRYTYIEMAHHSDQNFKLIEEDDIQHGDGVTDIDGNFYTSVIIGNQEWMAENLMVTKYNNGDAIPTGLNIAEWLNTTEGAFAIYNNDNAMLEAYGALYNWYAVDDTRGLCPSGWNVPSDAEWTELVDYVVAQGYPNEPENPNGASNALKSCRQVNSPLGGDCATSEHPRWNSHSTHYGTDEFSFSALPGGYKWPWGGFLYAGYHSHWWSSTQLDAPNAWIWTLHYDKGNLIRHNNIKNYGFSVRCVRNID